jgi:hypothetical protein
MKKITLLLSLLFMTVAFTSLKITSNPNCPTGYSTAPSLNGTTVRNCTSCHSGTVNPAGGNVTAIGLPTTFTAGQSYPFSIKITHSAANRTVWGVSIKAIDTLTHAVIGTWTTTNPNTSIKGTPTTTNGNYELSHANAATSTASATYTYSNLTWTAPSLPTAVQSRVKFYIAAVAGNGSGDESGDFVYTTSLTANQYVAPPACTFTYGAWTTCSNGTQTRSYTTSPAGCTGTPPADSITRTCTVVPPTSLPTPVTITGTINPGVCDTIRTFTVQNQSGVFYAWVIGGTGNYITNGQGTNTITAVVKVAGSVTVSLSNSAGSIPSTSLAFTRALPPTPTAINGSLNPCPNSVSTYSLTNPTPSATQIAPDVFRWTIPAFSTITSANADSSQITLSLSSNYVGGTLSAKGTTNCGISGVAKSIVLAPSKAVDVISSTGFWNGCIGNSVNYFVVSPTTSTSPISVYRWSIPAFTTISSANADSSQITLQFNTGYKGGSLKVQSSTSCGALGTAVSKTLTHVGCAAGQRGSNVEELVIDQVALFPNPNNGTFTLNVESSVKKSTIVKVQIYDIYGKMVGEYTTQSTSGIFSKNITNTNLNSGIYFVTYVIGNTRKTIKMVVQK